MKARLMHVINQEGAHTEDAVWVWCPGCQDLHQFRVEREGHEPEGPTWDWDRNLESPTFSPSLKVMGTGTVCHSFLKGGVWEFLSDCTHALKGQKAPMHDLPKWLEGPSAEDE